MPGLKARKKTRGGAYTFRISDVVQVPLRGTVLRLRVLEGTPSMSDVAVGSELQLRSPAGDQRTVTITAYAVTSGRASQARLDRVREVDVVVADPAAAADGPVEIGWVATGPAA
ncbi:MAG: hypothetical protein ACREK1_03880 [Longimicrobiales bacterium]